MTSNVNSRSRMLCPWFLAMHCGYKRIEILAQHHTLTAIAISVCLQRYSVLQLFCSFSHVSKNDRQNTTYVECLTMLFHIKGKMCFKQILKFKWHAMWMVMFVWVFLWYLTTINNKNRVSTQPGRYVPTVKTSTDPRAYKTTNLSS